MADLISRLIVKLIDEVSGPAKLVGAAVQGLTGMQTRIGLAIRNNNRALAETGGRFWGAAAAVTAFGVAIGKPIHDAAAFQTLLLDMGQKADLSKDQIGDLGSRIQTMSKQFSQSSMEIGKGVDNLLGRGLDPDRAMAIIPIIAKTAAAYRSTIDDISVASFAVLDNMQVPVDQLTKSLDIMSQSGKEGAFELKDMAREFPGLTASARGLGMTGNTSIARLAAALQIARKGAADGAEAANNTANLMQKIISPETTAKFKKFGIDIRKELKATQESGGDIFEMIAAQTMKAVKNDQGKIGDVFQDAQVRKFLLPLIQNMDEYKRIRDKSLGADGVIEKDFVERLETAEAAMTKFSAAMQNLGITIGNALIPVLTTVIDKLGPIIDAVMKFASENPKLVATIVAAAAALLLFNVAAIATRFLMLSMRGGMLAATSAFLSLINPLGLVSAAFTSLRTAIMTTGIGAIVVGIALAGMWIYDNWSGLAAMFQAFADTIAKAFPGLAPIIDTVKTAIGGIIGFLGDLTGKVNMTEDEWRALGVTMANAVVGFIDKVKALPGEIASWFATLPATLKAVGQEAIQALADGIMAGLAALPGMVSGAAAKAGAAIGDAVKSGLGMGGADMKGLAPALKGLGAPDPRLNQRLPGKASGGDFRRGTFMVGENGPELLRMGVSGNITPNHALGKKINFNPHVEMHIHGVGDAERVAELAIDKMNRKLQDLAQTLFGDGEMRTV